jgi:hypothetical protein
VNERTRTLTTYNQYRRKQIAELADWSLDFDMTGVSVSDADKAAGSPKPGDKIARNPVNHADRWLVADDYFAANFEALSAPSQAVTEGYVMVPRETLDRIEQWSKAYPLEIFPEPDFTRARELLKAGGMTIDSVSASNMRHVITEVWAMLSALRSAPPSSQP